MNAKITDVSILYVEDNEFLRESIYDFLNRRFDNVLQAENGATGLEMYRKHAPDILMTDIRMPIMDGLEMSRAILKDNSKAAIIVTSAYDEANYLLGAIELGISHYLLKPLDRNKVEASLLHCIELVRKARSFRERESYIDVAYQSINSLVDFGEEALCDDTTNLTVGIECPIDQMVENFYGTRAGALSNSPGSLIMTLTHGMPGEPEWLRYGMDDAKSVHITYCLDHPTLDLAATTGNHALYYINEGDPLPDDPCLIHFVEHFERNGEKPRNLVWYRNISRIVCCFNYPLQVTACDAAMVKNLAVQTRYMDAISAQRHQTEEAFHYTITSLARAAEANDEHTGNHILRIGKFCAAICRQIGYSDEMSNVLEQQSQLHDVGKIHVTPEILKKPGKLTDAEMKVMREHPLFGAKIIGTHPRLEIARNIALFHHEHWDGSGYPYGLSRTGIPLDARIAAIADTYDALRHERSYKPAFDHDTAYRIIVEGDGRTEPSHFDPDILRIFKKINNEFDAIYGQFAAVK